MKLVLTDSLFQQSDDLDVLGLLQRAVAGRCYLDVRSPRADAYLRWVGGLLPGRRDAWERQLEWSLRDGAVHRIQSIEVTATGASDWTSTPIRLNVADATRLVDLPFTILLENARYDRAFLLAMAAPSYRPLLERLEKDGLLRFHGVGGLTELRLVVEQQISHRPDRRLTHWALFDGDAPAPGFASKDASDAAATCHSAELPFHRLQRRAIENYVPRGALADWAEDKRLSADKRRTRVSALFSLATDQRHHYHFKSGFNIQMTPEGEALYANVPGPVRAILANGLSGSEVGKLFHNDIRGRIRAQMDKDGAGAELVPSLARLMELLRVPHG